MYDSTNGNLSYDADGNGGGVAQIFAVVSRGLPMSASNFLLAWVESVDSSSLVLTVLWTASLSSLIAHMNALNRERAEARLRRETGKE